MPLFFSFFPTPLLILTLLLLTSIDDVKPASFEGLRMVPIDILQQGSRKIVEFMLDMYRSPDGDALYRSKLMVVGFESVGKTTILDCLFPLEGWLLSQGQLVKTRYWYKLQGSTLSKFDDPGNTAPHKGRTLVLQNRQWEVVVLPNYGVRLVPVQRNAGVKVPEFYCPNEASHAEWVTRLRRVCMNEATHGIEIQSVQVDNEITRKYFERSAKKKGKKAGRLELSVWDFAGQVDYYHNHHYFLSMRTVFMVLWKMSDGEEKGMKGLEFWFKALSAHLASSSGSASPLPSSAEAGDEKTSVSIVVVGTFLDHPSVREEERNRRATLVDRLAVENGLSVQYFEVSCSPSLENIDIVKEAVLSTALSHAYIGEEVPKSYLQLEALIKRLREEKRDLPMIGIETLNKHVDNLPLVKRALNLLTLWGECVYFESPPELASFVILDPRFLAKGILADLFTSNDTSRAMKRNGVMRHADLVHIWKQFSGTTTFSKSARIFVLLLQQLGVCFIIEADKDMPFEEQRSVIPALLSSRTGGNVFDGGAGAGGTGEGEAQSAYLVQMKDRFEHLWPLDPPRERPIEMEQSLLFNVIPFELVSRLLVRLHAMIQESLVWRDEVLIFKAEDNVQAWLRISIPLNSFTAVLRGPTPEACEKLASFVFSEVKVGCENYPGVTFTKGIRSPFSTAAVISLEEVSKAKADPETEVISCPETRFPLRPDLLLSLSGNKPSSSPPRDGTFESFFFSFSFAPKQPSSQFFSTLGPHWWEGVFAQVADESLGVQIYQGGSAVEEAPASSRLSAEFTSLITKLAGKPAAVATAYAVNNPKSRKVFSATLDNLQRLMRERTRLFLRQDWNSSSIEIQSRTKAVLAHLGIFASGFPSLSDGFMVRLLCLVYCRFPYLTTLSPLIEKAPGCARCSEAAGEVGLVGCTARIWRFAGGRKGPNRQRSLLLHFARPFLVNGLLRIE